MSSQLNLATLSTGHYPTSKIHRETCREFVPLGPFHCNPQQMFLILWLTKTSGVKALNGPTTKVVLSLTDTTENVNFQGTVILIQPRGLCDLRHFLSWAPVLWVIKVLPHSEVKRYLPSFMERITGFSPSHLSLQYHASCTKLLHTASPWLPLAFSICLPSAWRALEL